MENASKALIIAGTALILMLLIAGGMIVFNNAGGLNGSVRNKLSDEQINTFNDQFQKFSGKQKGSRVKELITAVNKSNERSDIKVSFSSPSIFVTGEDIYYPTSKIINEEFYNITFEHDKSNVITTVNIDVYVY